MATIPKVVTAGVISIAVGTVLYNTFSRKRRDSIEDEASEPLSSSVKSPLSVPTGESSSDTVEYAQTSITNMFSGLVGTVMINLGVQLGLFTTAIRLKEFTSDQLAIEAGNLSPRLVKEWLYTLTCHGIFEFNPDTEKFIILPSFGMVLSQPGTGAMAELILTMCGRPEPYSAVKEAFKNRGGTSYEDYPGFSIMNHNLCVVKRAKDILVNHYLPIISKELVEKLHKGINVAEFGCGCGHDLNTLAKAFPASKFYGFDLLEDSIKYANDEAKTSGILNVEFHQQDINELKTSETYDFIMVFNVIHDLTHPTKVIQMIHSLLKPSGIFLMADVNSSSHLEENLGRPMPKLFYGISVMHCCSISLGKDGTGEGLGAMWGRQKALEILQAGNFKDIKIINGEPPEVLFVCKK